MQRAKDEKEREKVIAKFDQWVADLTMPYFKEHRSPDGALLQGRDSAFSFKKKPSEEERQLKEIMCDLACKEIRYSSWCGPGYQLYQTTEQYCKKMLKELHYSHTAEEWLKFLEDCWVFIEKLPQRNMIVSKVIDKVVTLEHIERLEKWSLETFGDRNRTNRIAKNRKLDKRAPKKLLELIELKRKNVNAATECKDVFFDTVKRIFKDKYKDKDKEEDNN